MNSSTSGWLVLTRNFLAGSHPQNDNFSNLSNAVAIAGGGAHSLAVQPDGSVIAWGFNNAGQATVPDGLSNVVAIAGGGYHSLAVVGVGPPATQRPLANRFVAQEVDTVFFYASAAGGAPLAYQWQCSGTNVPGATNAWLALTNVSPAQAGPYSLTVSNASGTAITPGLQLLVVPAVFSEPPQDRVAYLGGTAEFPVGVKGSEPITYQWRFKGGDLVGETNSVLVLQDVDWPKEGTYSVVVSNRFGSVQSRQALLSVVNVAGWGRNDDWPSIYKGQSSAPATLGNAVAVAAGNAHSLALRNDGLVVAWGDNRYGQINVPAGLSNVIAIAAGSYHNLALRSDGTVTGWGSDNTGESDVPAGLSNVVAIAAGAGHNLALRADGIVVAWGGGQTNVPDGLSNVVAIAAGDSHSLVLRADGTMMAWGYYSLWNPSPPPIGYEWVPMTVPAWISNSITDVVAIASGGSHCLALEANGRVLAWGDNRDGQTSVPSGLRDVVALAGGRYHSLALQVVYLWPGPFFTVTGWGDNSSGQANIRSDLRNVLAITAGTEHNLALIGTVPPILRAPLSNASLSNNGFSVSLPGQSGRVYALEFKNSLTDNTWTALPLVPGNGGIQTLTDPMVTNVTRFYRVRQW